MYTKLKQGEAPRYGTSGEQVKTLQQTINALNAGNQGYVPIKEDGLYGQQTQKAYNALIKPKTTQTSNPSIQTQTTPTMAPVAPQTPLDTEPTLGEAFKPSEYDNLLAEREAEAKKLAGSTIDEESIKQQKIIEAQAQVDAYNKLYADKLARAKVQGQGRIGQQTAMSARAGSLGSDFGVAEVANVEAQNQDIYSSIENERQVAINQILSKAKEDATAEIRARREAKERGASEQLAFAKSRQERLSARLTNAVGSLIAGNIDINSEDVKNVAKALGVSMEDIKGEYNKQKKEEKEKTITVASGSMAYRLNPATGNYELIADNPKVSSFSTKKDASGNIIKYQSDLDAIIGATSTTIGSQFGQKQFESQIERARNDSDKINLVASTVLKNAPSTVKEDFSNQAIAVSNIDKALAEIEKGAQTGVLNNAIQKGYNLFGKDNDPALSAITAYITSAVQPYRNSVTGAAWGEQEEAEYQALFGNTSYSPDELRSRLQRVKEIMIDKSAKGLNAYVNPLGTYENIFYPQQNTATNEIRNIEDAKLRIANIESRGSKDINGGNNPYLVISGQKNLNQFNSLSQKQKENEAYGKYQVMGFNIPTWTKNALGTPLTIEQFLNSPEAQEKVFEKYFQESKNKYGTWEDAASVWFTGQPIKAGYNPQDKFGTSAQAYVNKFTGNNPQITNQVAQNNNPLGLDL